MRALTVAVVLAGWMPGVAWAKCPPEASLLAGVWPSPGATDVPIDTDLAFVVRSWVQFETGSVTIRLDGRPVPSTGLDPFLAFRDNRPVLRFDLPDLTPDAEHRLDVVAREYEGAIPENTVEFTTTFRTGRTRASPGPAVLPLPRIRRAEGREGDPFACPLPCQCVTRGGHLVVELAHRAALSLVRTVTLVEGHAPPADLDFGWVSQQPGVGYRGTCDVLIDTALPESATAVVDTCVGIQDLDRGGRPLPERFVCYLDGDVWALPPLLVQVLHQFAAAQR